MLDSFLSFLKKYENKKAHNMISLMVNPKFKNFHIVPSFVGMEQGVALVKEYHRITLYLMLVKCYEHLHPLVRLDKNYADQIFLNKIVVWIFLNKLQTQMNQTKSL